MELQYLDSCQEDSMRLFSVLTCTDFLSQNRFGFRINPDLLPRKLELHNLSHVKLTKRQSKVLGMGLKFRPSLKPPTEAQFDLQIKDFCRRVRLQSLFADQPQDPNFKIVDKCPRTGFAVFNYPTTCQDGHSFCKEYITKWRVNKTSCPVDRSNLNGLLVRNLAVKGNGLHSSCISTLAFPASDHLPNRTVKCSSCTFEIPHSELSAHNELCCPNNCGVKVERCKLLSHLAFVCVKEGRPCPPYAVGCTKVHSSAEADSAGHLKLLLNARLSGACGGANVSLGGFSSAGSWRIESEVTVPMCSPLFDGHAAVVRLEISNGSDLSVKLFLESKLELPCFGVDLRCCFRCGVDKVNTPRSLMSQASVACFQIHNVCTAEVFQQMTRNSNAFFLDFLLRLSVWFRLLNWSWLCGLC
ncbi:uncharacterized protein [Montipora foliosa]|uniref:uncharacterized protein n=1 Tax=Montipora foliosa TaxID=591990 RepID=UPI0035F1D420